MKTVFTGKEVPHIWAQQSQEIGRASNIFFEGATIFSYGKHFPIATIEGNDVLFTLRSYSNTTAKHVSRTRNAVSHHNIIYCYDVPVKYKGDKKPLNKQPFTGKHEANLNHWKNEINALFLELGNNKNRDISGRINAINTHIEQLNKYVSYFAIKIKDTELKNLIKIASSPDFLTRAREAKEKQDLAKEKKLKEAQKAYELHLNMWRNYDTEGYNSLNSKTKELISYYTNNLGALTRLRYNAENNRIETSKGVLIPAPIAKKAYTQLNGCMEGSCNDISVPVMDYTITETGKDYIKAGCHTIPKEDVRYIANLLKW